MLLTSIASFLRWLSTKKDAAYAAFSINTMSPKIPSHTTLHLNLNASRGSLFISEALDNPWCYAKGQPVPLQVAGWVVMIISITLGYLLYLVILRKVWQRGMKIPINMMIAVEETVLTVGYTCWHGVILAVMATEKPLVHFTGSQFCQASKDELWQGFF